MTHLLPPLAYVNCKQPMVLWCDALYASLMGFYSRDDSASTIHQANQITSEFLSRCALAIFSSEWAARGAIEYYGVDKNKVHIVPFGANIESPPSFTQVKDAIMQRSAKKIKLLFAAKLWQRKGGDIVFKVAEALHAKGISVELNIVGCTPPPQIVAAPFVICHGYLSKRKSDETEKLAQLFLTAHFLFVPSLAEAYGLVFCEANAFGVPCIASYVGGISTIIKNNENGMTFSLNTPTEIYCDYILRLVDNETEYQRLALSSFDAFQSRLNWQVAGQAVKTLLNGYAAN